MGTSLSGLLPQDTYQGLIKVGDNTAITSTLKTLSDGAGNNLPMQASSTGINFTGTTSGLVSGVSGAIQFSNGSAFASDAANLFWDDTNNRLGIGTNAPTTALELGGSNSIKLGNDGSLFLLGARFATNNGTIYFGDVNGSNTGVNLIPQGGGANGSINFGAVALAQFKGKGSTSATTSLLVQNSAGTNIFKILDDGTPSFGGVGLNGKLNFNRSSDGGGIAQVGTNGGLMTFTEFSGAGFRFDDGYGKYPLFMANGKSAFNKGSAPVASAQVEIVSTTGGFLPPVMTTTQKNAIASPAAGLVVYDSTMNATCEYTGTAWRVVSAGAQAVNVTGLLQTVSLADGNVVNITLNSSTTFTLTNPALGTYILKLTQGTGGGFLVIWPGTVIWSGGTAPTLTTTAGKVDIITLVYDGTNYYGNYSLNY